MNPWQAPFCLLDQVRRLQGGALDWLGLGPQQSRFELAAAAPGFRLRRYGRSGAPLLLVPAPIKRPYIWDLAPARSVVAQAGARGFRAFLAEWTDPSGLAAPPGLDDYASRLLAACVDAACAEAGSERAILVAHSLGGVFAALYSALHPGRVAALVLVDVPLAFGATQGAFAGVLALGVSARALLPGAPALPGSLLSLVSAAAAPGTFCTSRYLDLLASMGSARRLRTHWQVERWTLDELPMSHRLFDDVVEDLYRGDRFMRGTLAIGGKVVRPQDVVAPLLSVYQPGSDLLPQRAVLAFDRAAGSAVKALLPCAGDPGTALGHVAPLVGDHAHRHCWPRVFEWLRAVAPG